jgi:hypothetical protein
MGRLATVLTFFTYSCGGHAVVESSPQEVDAGASPDAGACPADAPMADDPCPTPGMQCQYARFYCWYGLATCTRERTWQLIGPVNCPAEFPSGLCDGTGECGYVIDVGCGPVEVTTRCECVDATSYFTVRNEPELCDCSAIGSDAVCKLYPSECEWSDEGGVCNGRG